MTFDRLNVGLDFACQSLFNCFEDINNDYLRLIDSDYLSDDCFKSYFELGIQLRQPCSDYLKSLHRGVSVINAEKLVTINKFTKNLKKYNYQCLFRFKSDAGLLALTNKRQRSHHTFFKSDDFNIQLHIDCPRISQLTA